MAKQNTHARREPWRPIGSAIDVLREETLIFTGGPKTTHRFARRRRGARLGGGGLGGGGVGGREWVRGGARLIRKRPLDADDADGDADADDDGGGGGSDAGDDRKWTGHGAD